jgi:ABC-type polysaccharide/polyol phosphate export permease
MISLHILLEDIKIGLKRVPLALTLAQEDLKDRYRRSVIGISWIVLSFIAFITVKAFVFGSIFESDNYNYFAHLVIGFALFNFISACVTGASNLYIKNRTWILSSNLPYTLYAHALIIRNFIELLLLSVVSGLLIFFFSSFTLNGVWTIIPALACYYVTAFGLCMALSPLGAKVRDLVYATQTLLRVLFFATPVIWVPHPGTTQELVAKWNPLTYYIDVIRKPFVEGIIPYGSWMVVLAMTVIILMSGVIISSLTQKAITRWI